VGENLSISKVVHRFVQNEVVFKFLRLTIDYCKTIDCTASEVSRPANGCSRSVCEEVRRRGPTGRFTSTGDPEIECHNSEDSD